MSQKQTELPLKHPPAAPVPAAPLDNLLPRLEPPFPPIASQCEALGWTLAELFGKTAREIRVLGFEIPISVPEECKLREDGGMRTGVTWVMAGAGPAGSTSTAERAGPADSDE